ncbi:MAG: Opr family porin [Helicobacteraceae bacterium]|jgi:hypothetical protein|nr:Opr family porin [Helicobacteraceae bacterium]
MLRHIGVAFALAAYAFAASGGFLAPAPVKTNGIDGAFINGKHGGALSALGQISAEDDSFLYGYADLFFTTASYLGFRGDIGLSGVGLWWKDDDAFFSKDNAAMHTANLGFFADQFSVAFGRGKLDLVLARNYYQGAVAELRPNDQISVRGAYLRSKALTDYDAGAIFSDFKKFNDDGAIAIDVGFKAGDLYANPYFYHAFDIATWFGGKVVFDRLKNDSGFALTGHLAASAEDDESNAEDGFFLELQGDFKLNSNLGFFGGFALAGLDGLGSIRALGESYHATGAKGVANTINPFWDAGCQMFALEAKTLYAGVEFAQDRLWAGAMLGITSAKDDDYYEIDIRGEYAITKSFIAEAAFVTGDFGDDRGNPVLDSQTQIKFGVRYLF